MQPEQGGITKNNSPKEFIIVSGMVIEGEKFTSGIAANNPYPCGTLTMQAPYFKQRGLNLKENFQATINVNIKPGTFVMNNPEFIFPDVKWCPEHDAETFSFSRCRIIHEELAIDAFVFYHKKRNKKEQSIEDSVFEIIAPYIPGIHYGDQVVIEVNPDEIKVNLKES